jgi:hypothetical protein
MAEREVNKTRSRNLTIARETLVKIPKRKPREVFGVCVNPADELVTPGKIYKLSVTSELAGLIDDEGEAAVYPLETFLILSLPSGTRSKLAEVLG